MPSKKSAKKSLQSSWPSSNTTDPSPSLPAWPSLTPLLPESDLSLHTLLPTQILIIRHLFTSTLCHKLVSFFKTSLALNTTPAKPQKGEAVRVNDRFEVWDESFAERLWGETGLRQLVMGRVRDEKGSVEGWGGDVCGLNPRIRIYRYGKGQFFGKHYDDSNAITLSNIPAAKTTWTLLIYLSTCVGGETVFYPELPSKSKQKFHGEIVVQPEVGMALLHKHGQECLLHEGRVVEGGEKWVIRSDLCVKR
ncbi:hypothetical protein MMC31_001779 [Peltigera leucophlebia]|nr:hypothetical protein [Peltigera leucophlebia]